MGHWNAWFTAMIYLQKRRDLLESGNCTQEEYIKIFNEMGFESQMTEFIDCYSKIKDIVDRKADLENIDSKAISDILWQIQAEFDFVNSIVGWDYQDDFTKKIIGIFSAELKKRQ